MSNASPRVPSRPAATPLPDANPKRDERLLLVEDHPTNVEVIQGQLARLGYRCDVAVDGEAGLEAWSRGNYSLVITDLSMPRMDGYEMVRRIREEEARRNVSEPATIIAITANCLPGDRERCLAVGMNDFLSKPASIESLRSALSGRSPGNPDTAPVPVRREMPVEPEPSASTQQAEPPSAESASEPMDLQALGTIFGSSARVARMLDKYTDTLVMDLDNLQAAFAGNDPQGVSSQAHRIKGAARIIGAERLGNLAEQLERLGEDASPQNRERLLGQLLASAGEVASYIIANTGNTEVEPD